MSTQVGLWIDHRRAFVVHLAADETTTETIVSDLEKHEKVTGGSRSGPYGPQDVIAEGRADRKFTHHLEQYYDRVARSFRSAESIFIMGPGEAKGEFRKHLEQSGQKPLPIIKFETADKMTEAQIVARVREHYLR